ncbi:MAG: ATP-binding protein [Prevotellaceae bacterium]|nr:ATP-binding protein [Candidatus Faecinaster equi]
MYIRPDFQIISNRIKEERKFIQVIVGPRQVGKTTLVKQVLQETDIPYQLFNADGISSVNSDWIGECWQQVRLWMKTQGLQQMLLVIDEIQKIRNWSEVVKREWDADSWNGKNIKVLLLGSSRVLLEKGLSESLAGRFEEIRLSHWSYPEMREAFGFSLEDYMYYGGYPGGATLTKSDAERWENYISSSIVDATINKDILNDTPIAKPALLRQTFELASAYSGEILSYTKMLGQLQDAGNTVTLAHYLNLLSDSGLVGGIQKFSMDISRRRGSIPKLQVYDNALKTIYQPYTLVELLQNPKEWGHTFESAIGSYIMNQSFIHRFDVYYWREQNMEVDYILVKKGRIIAIEVKSNAVAESKGLLKFKELYHPCEAFIVGEGGMKAEDFLSLPLSRLF